MPIYLSGEIENRPKLDDLTPRQIVEELDKYVVGQDKAKRAVAVALRNQNSKAKITARNCTGCFTEKYSDDRFNRCRKTEIARRLGASG